jgi:hypothetical protein
VSGATAVKGVYKIWPVPDDSATRFHLWRSVFSMLMAIYVCRTDVAFTLFDVQAQLSCRVSGRRCTKSSNFAESIDRACKMLMLTDHENDREA